MIKLRRGLDIPISGRPEQAIHDAERARSVALVGFDYVGMKPVMAVRVGERVKLGQTLFSDRKSPGTRYPAPAAGTVSAINRGARRVLQSVVIDVDLEREEAVDFGGGEPGAMDAAEIRALLRDSGQWTALRARPYGRVPAVDACAEAIFITAMDTQPLAADPALVIAGQEPDFLCGQLALARLTAGKLYVCAAPGAAVPLAEADNIVGERFAGPHPAGLAGTHIHFLHPVGAGRSVWTIGYQDVIALGKLLRTGRLHSERVVALGGPQVLRPRLLRTRLGADLRALCAGELREGENRIISGSVLGGRRVYAGTAYLGRYHNQVSALLEGRQRQFLAWLSPGLARHSSLNIYLSALLPRRPLAMTTNTNGSERAMVPVGSYEEVMPLDLLPTQLLRALIVGDTETAQLLGCLELDEEDLALCSYVCPGKYEYGPLLRDSLTRIERGD